jgi:MFS family permease
VTFLRDLFERWWQPSADASGPPLGLLMGMFFSYVGIGMVWSILTVYATSLGASAATAGFTISAFGASRFLVSYPAGMISERLGRIRVMLVGLVLVASASFIALAVHSMTTLIICLMLQGVGSACYGTAALSAVTDRGTPVTRVHDMAAYQTATQIGIAIGPALGGLSAAAWGYGAPFACQGVLALIAFLAVMHMPADKIIKPQREALASAAGVVTLIAGAAALSYAMFFSRVASSWFLMPLIGHKEFGMGIGSISALLTASAIANLVILRFVSLLVRRYGRFSVLSGSVSMILAALAILAFAVSGWMLWPFTILMGIGTGLTSALVTAYAADAAPPGRIGAVMGSMRMMTDLGAITGPSLAGFCVDQPWLGIKGGIGLCAAVLIVTSAIFLATAKGLLRNSPSLSG